MSSEQDALLRVWADEKASYIRKRDYAAGLMQRQGRQGEPFDTIRGGDCLDVWPLGARHLMGHSPGNKTFRLVRDAPPADEAVYHALLDCHVAFANLERAARAARNKKVKLDGKGLTQKEIARLE
jgi:hypothetical protein